MAILGALKLVPSPPALAGAAPPATSSPAARSSVHFHLANAGAAALVAASLLVADPAVAFIVRPPFTPPPKFLRNRGVGIDGACGVAAGRRPVREAGDAGAGPHRQGLQRPDARQAGLQDGILRLQISP